MLEAFLKRAEDDSAVYIGEVRTAFQRYGTRHFHCHVVLYDGSVRRFPLLLPGCAAGAEADFVVSYVHAMLYNIISSLGAARIDIYIDPSDSGLNALANSLDDVFQVRTPKAGRTGYGKCLNVNERTLAALRCSEGDFGFFIHDISEEPAVAQPKRIFQAGNVYMKLLDVASDKMVMGMDVGGTDVKIVVSVRDELVLFKEFDWFPASFGRAGQLVDPLISLTRLMRAAASLHLAGRCSEIDNTSLERNVDMERMERGISEMEAAAGLDLCDFDAIGLCFPDVVIRNRIIGGETYKTRGMRENKALDYEEQFSKITGLTDRLASYVVAGGAVMNINDGPMAAFTTAMEQAVAEQDVSKGFFAHTLGTELGAGWILPDGSIPEIPLETYNFIVDLGSSRQKGFEPDDIRSINNFNTELAGTLQKYACQSGVFRLAAKMLPDTDPSVWEEAFDKGLFIRHGDKLVVPTEPVDLRKPCLEFFMEKATLSDRSSCAEILRQVGESLGACWMETEYILYPEVKERTLFGRLVKNPVCFHLLCEGADRVVPGLRLLAADESLANTPLMRQLEAHPDYTVAQFAQAVGAVYYGCLPFASRMHGGYVYMEEI